MNNVGLDFKCLFFLPSVNFQPQTSADLYIYIFSVVINTTFALDKVSKRDSDMTRVSSTGKHVHWDRGLQQAHVQRRHLG